MKRKDEATLLLAEFEAMVLRQATRDANKGITRLRKGRDKYRNELELAKTHLRRLIGLIEAGETSELVIRWAKEFLDGKAREKGTKERAEYEKGAPVQDGRTPGEEQEAASG